MNEKPRSADESILTKDFLGKVGLEGLVVGAMTMIGFLTGYHQMVRYLEARMRLSAFRLFNFLNGYV